MDLGVISVCRGRETISQTDLYDELLAEIAFADQVGLKAYWLGEHHFSTGGTVRNTLLMLAAASQRTTRIRLGSGVVVLPLHHPVRVAEEAAMADHLTRGRLDLGVGLGGRPRELAGYGVSMEDRVSRFNEALEVIRRAWSGMPVTFHGERFTLDDLSVLPAPVQRPHPPIWQAVHDPAAVEAAAKNGDNLLLSGLQMEPEPFIAAIKSFKSTARAAGHKNSRVGFTNVLYLGGSDAEVRDVGMGYLRRHYSNESDPSGVTPSVTSDPLRPSPKAIARFERMTPAEIARNYAVETPDHLVDRLKRMQKDTDNGIDLFIASPHFGAQESPTILHTLKLLATEVAPLVA